MISNDDLNQIGAILGEILQNDNNVRKAAEERLNQAKRAEADRYAATLAAVFHPSNTQFTPEVKSLAAVILRRGVSVQAIDSSDLTDVANNANLW